MSDTNTLDGMSIDQLRELARRAEAAAKVQEEKKIVVLGEDPQGYAWKIGGDGILRFKGRRDATWLECHQPVLEFVTKTRKADAPTVAFLVKAMLDKGLAGAP